MFTNKEEEIEDENMKKFLRKMDGICEVLVEENVIPIFIFNEFGYVIFPIDEMKKIRKPVFTHISRKYTRNRSSDGRSYWGKF